MRHEIVVSPDAAEALRKMRAHDRAAVLEAMETHLRRDPTQVSRSRIKALRDLRHPQYRLRVGEIRVFYDVEGMKVNVLAVVDKAEASAWLARWGIRVDEGGRP